MSRAWFAIVAFVLGFASPALGRADAAPSGMRGVAYRLTIENLDAFANHVFFVFPTTNHGFAYRVEPGKGISALLMRDSWKGPASELYAIAREEFERQEPKPARYKHGDDDADVFVFKPPAGALVASAYIAPPDLVPTGSPVRAVERVFRIVRVTKDAFEVALVRNDAVMSDGTQVAQPIPTSSASSHPTASSSATTTVPSGSSRAAP